MDDLTTDEFIPDGGELLHPARVEQVLDEQFVQAITERLAVRINQSNPPDLRT